MMNLNDTIYALSSGALPAGVAIIRISGKEAGDILQALTGKLPVARRAQLAVLRTREGDVLDRGVVIFFPEGSSFTGEAVAELHLHGGRAVVQAVLDELGRFPGTRSAEAGEFTRRAFINGRMDLTAAEGIADLIAADTEAQRRFALINAGGQQERLYSSWRMQLIEARAAIEADLDFSDEGDVPGSVADSVVRSVAALKAEIAEHLAQARRGEILREGFRVVIIGEPNVGKSTLLNALARRDAAIVSDQAGTTRDLIEVALDLNGFKVIVTDTAGLRETDDQVERIGIDRAREAARSADVVLHLFQAGEQAPLASSSAPRLLVATKADLARNVAGEADCHISVVSSAGVAELLQLIAARAASAAGSTSSILPSQERQVLHLRRCVQALEKVAGNALPLELQAEELRLAADHLGRITGAIGVEDLLDVVFSRFCIGK